MKPSFEFPISSELHTDHLVKQEPHEVKRFRHCAALISLLSHGDKVGGWFRQVVGAEDGRYH